jgi:selenocysteine lyase/cysteine desulfurase
MKRLQNIMSLSGLRGDFPGLAGYGAYLDNAATTHKPEIVIEAISRLYREGYAPLYRGMYRPAEELTARFENVRKQVARFMGIEKPHEIVLTHGATDAMNTFMVAWAESQLKEGDEVVFTELDHHMIAASWFSCAQKIGIKVKKIPLVEGYSCWLARDQIQSLITPRTRVVSFPLSSNIRGPLSPGEIEDIVTAARSVGALVVADACQVPAHQSLAELIKKYQFDVVIWSGHKCFAPSGVGVLYLAEYLHSQLRPYQYGGGMLYELSSHAVISYREMPRLLEAGTRPAEAVIGLGAALEYLESKVNYNEVREHEAALVRATLDGVAPIPGITLLGDEQFLRENGHILTFMCEGVSPHDIAWFLAERGIAVRAGDHCCQLLHRKLGILGSVRLSFALYNDIRDVEQVCCALRDAVNTLR